MTIIHTFAGSGVYPVVDTQDKVIEAARSGQPAALVFVGAQGPRGTIGFDRLNQYSTSYEPLSEGGGGVSVTVNNAGRYRFDISELSLRQRRSNRPDDIHPDAPESISLNLNNGQVP